MKLEVTGLTKCYGKTRALDGLSLSVESSRVLVLIGPSGGGKSTLLRMLGGLEIRGRGHGRHQRPPPPRQTPPRSRPIAGKTDSSSNSSTSSPTSPPGGTSRCRWKKSTATHPPKPARWRSRRSTASACSTTPTSFPRSYPVASSNASASPAPSPAQPEILFLDEPTSALDPEMTAEVLELIQELAEAGQDIILSTHEMGFARAVADQVAFVAAGRIEEIAPPAELFGAPSSPLCQRFLSRVMRY